MSSFSYVEHEGRQFQVHFCDDFETRRVGDPVPWEPEFYYPGEWVNGVHPAYDRDGKAAYVVILDQRIKTIVPCIDPATDHGYPCIPEPPRDLWPPQAWEAKEWREQEHDRRAKADIEKKMAGWHASHPGATPSEIAKARLDAAATDSINDFTRAKMREPSMMALLFGPFQARPDLVEKVFEPIRQEFYAPGFEWKWSDEMRQTAVAYRMRRLLTEQGLWDEGPYRQRALIPCSKVLPDGRLLLEIKQLTERT